MEPLFSMRGGFAKVDAVSGACLMVRRSVFERVGMFSVEYFMYVEDLDLCYKITKAGSSIHYLPGFCVTHHGGRSSNKQEPYFASLRQRQATLTFFRRRKGAIYAHFYRAALAVGASLRIVLVICSFVTGRRALLSNQGNSALLKWWKTLRWAVTW
jgi:GT2 family glycosyltransferase